MSEPTHQILVTFPVGIELHRDDEKALHELIGRICKRYETAHPGRVMWGAGWGGYCTSMPITAQDDADGVPLTFDMSVLHCEVAERQDYRWPCAKCGIEQGDHKGSILSPKAGDCDFEPGCKPAKGISCDGEWHRGWSGHDPHVERCPRAALQPQEPGRG